MSAGIYQIKNDINGKIYVGKAKNLASRWKQHKDDLAKGEHANKYLQIDYDEMGIDAFTYSILEKVPECPNLDKVLFQKEREWGDKLGARGENGYNIANFYTKGKNTYCYNEVVKEATMTHAYCGVTVGEMTYILYHSSYECLAVLCLIRASMDCNCCDEKTLYKEDWALGIWNIEELAKASNLSNKELKECLKQLRDIKVIDWCVLRNSETKSYGFFNSLLKWDCGNYIKNEAIEKIMNGDSKKWKYPFKKCLLKNK